MRFLPKRLVQNIRLLDESGVFFVDPPDSHYSDTEFERRREPGDLFLQSAGPC